MVQKTEIIDFTSLFVYAASIGTDYCDKFVRIGNNAC